MKEKFEHFTPLQLEYLINIKKQIIENNTFIKEYAKEQNIELVNLFF